MGWKDENPHTPLPSRRRHDGTGLIQDKRNGLHGLSGGHSSAGGLVARPSTLATELLLVLWDGEGGIGMRGPGH